MGQQSSLLIPPRPKLQLWQQFFVSQYLNQTLGIGGYVARNFNKISAAMAKASGTSAFFTSDPVMMQSLISLHENVKTDVIIIIIITGGIFSFHCNL